MAEALLAVGLAANIVQFLDIGARFVSTSRKLHRSDSDGGEHWPDVRSITEDLQNVLQGLDVHAEADGECVCGLAALFNFTTRISVHWAVWEQSHRKQLKANRPIFM